ncbi:hypothetical protein ACEQ8H_004116 [Pleosporales sp. CAS-2024a]
MSFSVYVVVAAMVALATVFRLNKIGQRPKDYPPGPPTWPLIGNLHLMPKEKAHLQFQKWANEYGPVYSLILGTKVMIVLSSDQAIKDLLDKRSNIYSSRPDMYLGKVVSGGLRMLLMEYGETWRMIRKIVHKNLNIKAARSYVPYQDLENKAMLGFEKFSQVTGTQTAALLDLFPVLRHMPDFMLPLRRYAKKLHEHEARLYVGHWLNVKKAIKEKTAKPCFCLDLIRAQETEGFSDALAAYVSGSLLEAGSDTTAATLVGFVQAMLLFPDVARNAQEELDRVCGERLPSLEDEPNLPYIRGCIKESLRWMPTAILGVPHAVIRDDEYMGYKIPKGAGVMWNVWSVHMDPKRHRDPRRFDPGRYINDSQTAAEAANNPDASKRDHFVFGAGRRLCQGMHIAERSMFLAISRLLWAFDFRLARDAHGNEIKPNADDLTEGLLVCPKPFPACIVPRDETKAARVRSEWSMMESSLDKDLQWSVLPEGLIWEEHRDADKET